ncbi:ImmA/IrrE family metallo-endopeptidase [Hansschlegelia zhihuaiae]|uniref:ImmA/IrrE family metallo-endopeptidase n=1 Tax=Hansschlegelia zhihuaiae TaxID=405005 RepID=A0A4V1KHG5_9HYPH|nr:ImmA/IrrE family metallo-endopeptidase [Hansschlegelia zhihuaiae]RXF67112.1 ImmA/IrrE family metallo-endopeptidase [Hansschlegelia zhihuaiae]
MDHSESPLAVVARHQASLPVNLDAIARDLGIPVQFRPLGEGVAGLIMRTGAPPSNFQILINSTEHPNRQRFTLAHELAHFILHRDLIDSNITDDTMYRSDMSNYIEVQANKMAADILMPWRLVRKYNEKYNGNVEDLSRLFAVSKAAMQIRLDGLSA